MLGRTSREQVLRAVDDAARRVDRSCPYREVDVHLAVDPADGVDADHDLSFPAPGILAYKVRLPVDRLVECREWNSVKLSLVEDVCDMLKNQGVDVVDDGGEWRAVGERAKELLSKREPTKTKAGSEDHMIWEMLVGLRLAYCLMRGLDGELVFRPSGLYSDRMRW